MSSTKNNLPAMPFYVGDWLKCPEVRALPPDYRGLWFDLICFMWESTERGVMVKPNGKPYSDLDIIRIIGLDNQNSGIWLTHLLDNGVCFKREDGAIYSKRMVRDERIRKIRREVGSMGGNPNLLVNQTPNQNIEIENVIVNKEDRGVGKGEFNSLWEIYPVKDGKKAAKRYFNSSVKTVEDLENIRKALKNYLGSKKVKAGYIKNGSTWFNNWRDWVIYKEPEVVDDKPWMRKAKPINPEYTELVDLTQQQAVADLIHKTVKEMKNK